MTDARRAILLGLGAAVVGVGLAYATLRVSAWTVMLPVAVLAMVFAAKRPRAALVLWLMTLAFVPFWLTIPVGGIELPPTTIGSLLVLPALIGRHENGRPGRADWLLAVALLSTGIAIYFSTAPIYLLVALLVQGVTAYIVGRGLTLRVGAQATINTIAVVTALCGLWAVLEVITGVRVFENFVTPSGESFWRTTQERGGVGRSEAAWGHAIALGGWLSLGLPFTIASNIPLRRLAIAITALGALATLSRGPILGCLVGALLCVFFLRSVATPKRIALGATVVVASIAAAVPALRFIGAIGSELELTQDYRTGLLSNVADDVHLIGRADFTSTTADGRLLYRGFGSIDNTFLLFAVDAGALIAVLLGTGLIVALVRTLRGRGSVADVSLAAQLLVLATVSMVTQYQAAVFFVAGVAVALSKQREPTQEPDAQVPQEPAAVRPRPSRSTPRLGR